MYFRYVILCFFICYQVVCPFIISIVWYKSKNPVNAIKPKSNILIPKAIHQRKGWISIFSIERYVVRWHKVIKLSKLLMV